MAESEGYLVRNSKGFMRPALLVLGVMLVSGLLNFPAAAAEELRFSLLGLACTLVVLAVWFIQAHTAALKGEMAFAIFATVYWGLGFVLMLMLPLSARTGAVLLTAPAFIGLMMLYVPLYPLLPLAGLMGVNYLFLYPCLFVLLAAVYWLSYQRGMALRSQNPPPSPDSTPEAAQEELSTLSGLHLENGTSDAPAH